MKRLSAAKPVVADLEYWVFLPTEELPKQEDVLKTLFGVAALTSAEHLISSDIRLHVALVKRQRNPSAYRPDVLGLGGPEALPSIADSPAFARVRFLAEKIGAERRHLLYVPYMALATLRHAGGSVIADRGRMEVYDKGAFEQALRAEPRPSSAGFHVRIEWRETEAGGFAESHGMIKVGLPEVISPRVDLDERVLVCSILEAYVEAVWNETSLPESTDLDLYGDEFKVEPTELDATGRMVLRLRRARMVAS